MAEPRHPPAQPGASSLGLTGQGQDRESAPGGDTEALIGDTEALIDDAPAARPIVPPPPERSPPRKTKAYGPPALPPPLRPVGLSLRTEEEPEEQTTVDPQARLADPGTLLLPDPDIVDIDQKSVTTEALSHDSGHVMLERAILDEQLATGTGETGASIDDLTQDESRHNGPPSIELVRPPAPAVPISRMPPLPSDAALSPAWLVVQSGADRGRRFALRSGGRTSVGRGVDNDVVLTDIAVSRKHMTIEFAGSSYVMNDLNSGNGTLVNDRDEEGVVRLSHGDKLELGNTVLVFECTGAVGQPQPVGNWAVRREDDELSTVAGRRAGKPPTGPAHHSVPVGPTTLRGAPVVPPPPSRPGVAHRGMPSDHGGDPLRPPLPAQVGEPSSPFSAGSRGPNSQSPPLSGSGLAAGISPDAAAAARSPLPPLPTSFASPFPGSSRAAGGQTGQVRNPGVPGARAPLIPALAYPGGTSGFSQAPNTASAPRFQYPNGVMAPLPAAERRRVLIGILCIAFVAVSAGIIMALVYGGGAADVINAPTSLVAAEIKPAPPSQAAIAPGSAPSPTMAATAPAEPGPGAAMPAPSNLEREPRPADVGTTVPAGPAAASDGAAASPEVAARPSIGAISNEEANRDSERDRRERRNEIRRRSEGQGATKNADDAEPRRGAADDAEVGSSASDATTALRQAEALYKQKRFSEAAAVLRRAADGAGRKDVGRLRTLATNYGRIGTLLADGQAAIVTDAPRALEAFKAALRLDEEFGDSEHDRTIGARIAQVAPAAAGAYMARKDYPEAKAAADIAEKFGSGDSDRVRNVRNSLERRAEELYQEARSHAQAGDSDRAAETARLILRMVSRSSDVYAKAARLAGP